jgi:hypothetical protein
MQHKSIPIAGCKNRWNIIALSFHSPEIKLITAWLRSINVE